MNIVYMQMWRKSGQKRRAAISFLSQPFSLLSLSLLSQPLSLLSLSLLAASSFLLRCFSVLIVLIVLLVPVFLIVPLVLIVLTVVGIRLGSILSHVLTFL